MKLFIVLIMSFLNAFLFSQEFTTSKTNTVKEVVQVEKEITSEEETVLVNTVKKKTEIKMGEVRKEEVQAKSSNTVMNTTKKVQN